MCSTPATVPTSVRAVALAPFVLTMLARDPLVRVAALAAVAVVAAAALVVVEVAVAAVASEAVVVAAAVVVDVAAVDEAATALLLEAVWASSREERSALIKLMQPHLTLC